MQLDGKTIFVVEDDAANLAVISVLLKHHGASVAYDRWGKSTVENMKRVREIDMVLLDLMFPGGVSGYKVFDEIRSEPGFAQIPIVAVTASDPCVELPRVQKKGFSGFITKPVQRHIFPQQLEAILAGNKVWMTETIEE